MNRSLERRKLKMTKFTEKKAQQPDFSMRGNQSGAQMGAKKVKPKNTWATIKRIISFLNQHQKALLIVILTTIISTVLTLASPYLLGVAIDDYILTKDWEGLIYLSILLLITYVATALFGWIQQHMMVKVSQLTVAKLRQTIFNVMQTLPISYFDKRTHGELMSRATNDVENVSVTLNQSTTQLLSSIISIAGSFIIMLYLNVWLTLVCMVTIPIVMLFTKFVAKYTRKHFSAQQANLGQLNSFIEETISGQKVVQVYSREKQNAAHFKKLNTALTKNSITAQIYSGLIGPTMNVLNHTSFTLLAAIGGWMAFHNYTSVGIIVAFVNYSKQFQRPINDLANQFNMLQSAIAGAERVFEVIDMEPENAKDQPTHQLKAGQRLHGKVVFDHVNFGYNEKQMILKDISLHAKPGQTIALVGPTGAGKTTIINVLTRFYDIQAGHIWIDGQELRSYDRLELRSQLGIVLQDAFVLTESIKENIRYGRLNATDDEIIEAAKVANAHRFIMELPEGYNTKLSYGGSNLSQGQKQLITIARAVLANPAILILDEATSSIDTRTEMSIQAALKILMKDRTSFVIAHRLSTIREADQIVVIDDGTIIERGNHHELLQRKGFYYDLYNSQFKRNA